MADRVRRAALTVVTVTPKTRWIFVELAAASGLEGVGEATAIGREADVRAAFQRLMPLIFDLAEAAPVPAQRRPALPALADAAAYSALDQALSDIAARRRGMPVAALLGGLRRDTVPLYANINRRTADRSPAGFADSARTAAAAGHRAFKIAPFDEATPEARRAGHLAEAVRPGLERAGAVRAAIGPASPLMIDCHWRLEAGTAERVIDAAAEIGIHWVECPLPETAEHLDALARLRAHAHRRGLRLAGCEEMIRVEGFAPFLQAGAYDVIMPDAKYVGGLGEMMALAEAAARYGVEVSPHNPSGPVCHAASLQACAAMAAPGLLEVQFDETPLFQALQAPPLPPPVAGAAPLPQVAGLGIALDRSVLDRLSPERWTAP